MNKQEPMIIKTGVNAPSSRSFFSKVCLPLILLLSFVWLNLYSSLSELNSILFPHEKYSSVTTYLISSVLFISIIDYLMFELFFFIYRLFLGFSIYSFMIPKMILIDKFRFWYIIRNVALGFIFNIRFFMPYIGTYLIVFELIMNFVFVFLLFNDLKRDYVEPLVGQYVFRTLVMPILIYEVYIIVTQLVGVL